MRGLIDFRHFIQLKWCNSILRFFQNTKNGTIKGSFDRVNLFKQAAEEEKEKKEEEFDKLFNYNRQSIQNLLITTFNEKWFCNRTT